MIRLLSRLTSRWTYERMGHVGSIRPSGAQLPIQWSLRPRQLRIRPRSIDWSGIRSTCATLLAQQTSARLRKGTRCVTCSGGEEGIPTSRKKGLVFVRWRSHAPAQLFAPIDNEMRACLRPRAHVMGHNMEPRKIRSFMRVGKRLRGGTETPRMEHAVFAKQSRIRSE